MIPVNLEADIYLLSLVRESIAYPHMDFKKSTDINMDIHDFWMSVLIIHKTVIFMQEYSAMDIRKQ